MTDPSPLVTASDLTKRFGQFTAVDAVSFTIRPQETFGFLGPNGAGKTSTMRMIGCVSPITAGELEVLGLDPATQGREIRARLGVVPQENSLDAELTVYENLLIYGRFFGLPVATIRERGEELLRLFELWDRRDDRVDPLSGGMKRRLTIARALISDPELMLLDEPTTGLDPQARHLLWDRIHRLKQRGITFVLTTHYMDEAEQLCDRLVIMDRGGIIAAGSPRELIDEHVTREVVELRFGPHGANRSAIPGGDRDRSAVPGGDHDGRAEALQEVGTRAEILPDRVVVYTDDAEATTEEVNRRQLGATSVLTRRATLEDVFLQLTGHQLIE